MTDPALPYLEARQAVYAQHFSPLATLRYAWSLLTPEAQLDFLVEQLTPDAWMALRTRCEEARDDQFRYHIGQRVRMGRTCWCGTIERQRVEYRGSLGPVVDYLVLWNSTGGTSWEYEPDLLAEEGEP